MPEIEISEIFTNNLKKLLEIHNMTYKELAENIGVKASSVSMWMNGNSLPRMGTLDKIADLFNVSVESLVTASKERDTAAADHFTNNKCTDEKDIAKDMEIIRKKLMSGTDGPLSYDGEPIPKEDTELLLGQIELMMRRLKPINKEKYNPNKNKQ